MNKLVAVIVCLLVVIIPVCAVGCDGFRYSDGERVGIITKISKKGMFWQTWEADMTMFIEGSNGMPVHAGDWSFSIASDEVARDAVEAANSGQRVVVKYREYWARGGANGETNYAAVAVTKAATR